MLDDLREQASASPFFENNADIDEETEIFLPEKRFLGMTALQRFFIAVMLLMMTCILGTLFLLVFERVALPFL
jgi:hypothetical protein